MAWLRGGGRQDVAVAQYHCMMVTENRQQTPYRRSPAGLPFFSAINRKPVCQRGLRSHIPSKEDKSSERSLRSEAF